MSVSVKLASSSGCSESKTLWLTLAPSIVELLCHVGYCFAALLAQGHCAAVDTVICFFFVLRLCFLFVLAAFAALFFAVTKVVIIIIVSISSLPFVVLQEVLAQALFRFLRWEHGFKLSDGFAHLGLV